MTPPPINNTPPNSSSTLATICDMQRAMAHWLKNSRYVVQPRAFKSFQSRDLLHCQVAAERPCSSQVTPNMPCGAIAGAGPHATKKIGLQPTGLSYTRTTVFSTLVVLLWYHCHICTLSLTGMLQCMTVQMKFEAFFDQCKYICVFHKINNYNCIFWYIKINAPKQ